MKKRSLSIFLAIMMCLNMLPVTLAAEEETVPSEEIVSSEETELSEEIESSDFVIEDGVLTRYTGPGGDVVIPDYVTRIAEQTFRWDKNLTSVTIPDSVTEIGGYAFQGCTGLTSVTIPDSVMRIGSNAFSGCTGLTSVTIPDSVTEIGRDAFFGCTGLTSVTIPSGVTSIGDDAFYHCTSLTSVTIPSGVTSIGDYAFYHCTSLTSVTIPDSVTEIGSQAFYDCTSLANATLPSSASVNSSAFPSTTKITLTGHYFDIQDGELKSYRGPGGDVVIPDGVTEIGYGAFSGCTSLTGVTIPDSVTKIVRGAFDGCTSLAHATVPGSTNVKNGAFPSTTKITLTDFFDVNDGVLKGYNGPGGRVVIPNNVTAIAASAFHSNRTITEVVIPNSVTSIGELAFYNCTELTSVTIPDSVASIGYSAFSGCSKLSQVTLSSSVIWESGVFPRGTKVTLIGHRFDVEGGVLKGYNGPGGDIVIPEGVTTLNWSGINSDYALKGQNPLTSVTFPSTMTILSGATLYNQYSLTDVIIPASVTQIDDVAFCTGGFESYPRPLSRLTVHGAAGSYAETWAKHMGYTFVADQPWKVSAQASQHKFDIENGVLEGYSGPGGDVVVPNGVTDIYSSVLASIGTLTSLTLPAGIQTVWIRNPAVKRIVVGAGATYINLSCDSLESVTLPDSVESLTITSNTLRELTIPAGVSGWPFLNCPRLSKLTFPLNNWVFKGISRADFLRKIESYPALDEIVNCPNEFVSDLIAPNVALRDNWRNPQSTVVAQSSRITQLSNEITAGLTSDYDKARAISKWVVDHIKYDYDYYYEGLKDYSDVPFDPEEILDKGQAVCAGFARLTQALLVAQKIPCLYVLGNTSAGYHAWNLALLDGQYLWIDNTWGMKYFGLGVYAISRDHTATGAASFNNVKGPGTLVSGSEGTTGVVETADEILAREMIEALKAQYPEGMRWTDSNSYYSAALHSTGTGCAGFAYICSDAVFGDAPVVRTHSNFDEIRVGDILRINNNTHSVVVLQRLANSVIVVEGNYNSSVHWGREISRSDLEKGGLVVTTRWSADMKLDKPWATASGWAQAEVEAAITADLVPEDIQSDYTTAITRQDFCRLMVQLVKRVTGKSIDAYLASKGLVLVDPFTDTDNEAVLAAHALGIVNGRGNGIFDPDSTISRQEAAAMLTRTAKMLGMTAGESMRFTDTETLADWAKESIAFVSGLANPINGNRVMNGTDVGIFSPFGTYTREQAILTALRLFHCES